MFAKLYEKDDSQILVKIDSDENGLPEVRFWFEPEELGVCSAALSWKDDSDDSWDKAEKVFDEMTEEKANEFVSNIMSKFMGS